MNYLKKLYFTIFTFLICSSINSQISKPGVPYSFKNNNNLSLTSYQISKPSDTDLLSASVDNRQAYCIGILRSTDLSLSKNGTWTQNRDGSRSCYLKIKSTGAKGLSVYFKNFIIPEGAELFVYNENKKHVIGKFNSTTNNINKLTHTQVIQGDVIILEYYEPQNSTTNLKIELDKIGYYFRGFEDYFEPFLPHNQPTSTRADFCQVDVACAPENIGWSEQIDAVVHFTYTDPNYIYVCSASVINNTNQDCTPYILTAWHCGEPTANLNLSGYTWYWNYQKTNCQPNSNSSNPSKGNQTMINGMVKATSGSGTLNNPPTSSQVAGSDFTLIELNSSIPSSYNAYYAGWDRNNLITSGVGIHHPDGSAKKISTFNGNLTTTSYNNGALNAHWNVYWDATTNGHGITEGGSSGSPIFNQNKRIVGQLSGGTTFCSSPNSQDLYGKFSSNWTSNGSSPQSQLEPWLDPTGINVNNLDGTYSPCGGNSLNCIIGLYTDSINEGELIDFFGATNSNSSSWSWNLDVNGLGGVTPSTSSVQNPSNVLYSNAGIYDVRLTVSSGQSNCVVDTVITVLSLNNTSISTIDYEEIKIFPNPNNGCFSVKIPSIKSLSGGIYNHLGHKVETFKTSDLRNNIFEFNFTEMKAGLYFIRFDNYPNFSHKIIISKN
jgi:lysyl endopeptidase